MNWLFVVGYLLLVICVLVRVPLVNAIHRGRTACWSLNQKINTL